MNTKRKLLELEQLLNSCKSYGSAKFKYAAEKNLRILKPEIDKINSPFNEINTIIKDYMSERDEIIKKYGEPKDNIISVEKDNKNYDVAMNELGLLANEHKDSIELYEIEFNKYQLELNDEYESGLTFHELLINDIPDEFNGQGLFMDFGILK